MNETEQFRVLADAGALISKERQIHVQETVGHHLRWDVDLTIPSFTFTFPDRTLVCETQVIGTSALNPGSWLWAWANPSFAEHGTGAACDIREYGQQRHVEEFTTAELPLGEAGNSVPDAVWFRIATAITPLLREWDGYFPGTVGSSTKAIMMIRHPELALPAPECLRVARVIGEALLGMRITDHRLAVSAYVDQRGIPATWAESSCQLAFPDGTLTIAFEPGFGRIINISGDAHGGSATLAEPVTGAPADAADGSPADPLAASAPPQSAPLLEEGSPHVAQPPAPRDTPAPPTAPQPLSPAEPLRKRQRSSSSHVAPTPEPADGPVPAVPAQSTDSPELLETVQPPGTQPLATQVSPAEPVVSDEPAAPQPATRLRQSAARGLPELTPAVLPQGVAATPREQASPDNAAPDAPQPPQFMRLPRVPIDAEPEPPARRHWWSRK